MKDKSGEDGTSERRFDEIYIALPFKQIRYKTEEHMKTENYEILSEFYELEPDSGSCHLVVHHPKEKTENSRICVLATHGGDYTMGYPFLRELAKRGFTVMGMPQGRAMISHFTRANFLKRGMDFAKNYPGVEKVILMGHSQGGTYISLYQYLAENGKGRFETQKYVIEPEETPGLIPADGMMFVDTNYGFMDVLALDPACQMIGNSMVRHPEYDIFLPENGYIPGNTRYSQDFINSFCDALQEYHRKLFSYCLDRYDAILKGKGLYADDEPFTIPNAAGGTDFNKLFVQDNSLINHTPEEVNILHTGGSITHEIAYTCRPMPTVPDPRSYRMAYKTTVRNYLIEADYKFTGKFRITPTGFEGFDWESGAGCSCANVKGIKVPSLFEGNSGSHEFLNTYYSWKNSAAGDKEYIVVEGADHGLTHPVGPQYGNTMITFADYASNWLSSGRF